MPLVRCQYCGDEITTGHGSFGICCWCLHDIDEKQKKRKAHVSHGYFNTDKDDYKGEVDYG